LGRGDGSDARYSSSRSGAPLDIAAMMTGTTRINIGEADRWSSNSAQSTALLRNTNVVVYRDNSVGGYADMENIAKAGLSTIAVLPTLTAANVTQISFVARGTGSAPGNAEYIFVKYNANIANFVQSPIDHYATIISRGGIGEAVCVNEAIAFVYATCFQY